MKIVRFVAPLVFGLAFALSAVAATPVNINTADAATLAESLDGIGMVKAERIVSWREQHGPFESAEQLAEVKGVGERTLEENREAIRLSGQPASK